jgi:hypothetical protein
MDATALPQASVNGLPGNATPGSPLEARLLLEVSVADSMAESARLGSDVSRAKKQQVPSERGGGERARVEGVKGVDQ